MSSRFPASLRRLLRLRQSLERQEEMKLALAAGRLHTAHSGLEQSRAASAQQQRALRAALAEQLSGAELQVAAMQSEAEAARELTLLAQVRDLKAAHAEQRALLLDRTRERKILDLLQEHCARIERREQQRKEQAGLDEAFLLGKRP